MEKTELIEALARILSACSHQDYRQRFLKSSLRNQAREIRKIAKGMGLKFTKEDCIATLMGGQYELTEAFAKEALG